MARPRNFEPDAAIDRALDVFWSKGYEATSLDDLCAATGLSRSSFYAAFGSKKNMLLRTVTRYSEQRTPNLTAVLTQDMPVRDAFASLAQQFIDQIVSGSGRRGCFLGNCAAELPRSERAALTKVRDGLAATEAAFHDALVRGQSRGELAADTDLQALARYLTAAFQGLRLVGKVNPDRDALNDIANTMLQASEQRAQPFAAQTSNQTRKSTMTVMPRQPAPALSAKLLRRRHLDTRRRQARRLRHDRGLSRAPLPYLQDLSRRAGSQAAGI